MVRVILYNKGCKTFESKGTEFNSTVTYNLDTLDYCIDNADLRQADFKYLYLKGYSNLKDVENLSTDDHRNIFLLPEDIARDIIINGKKEGFDFPKLIYFRKDNFEKSIFSWCDLSEVYFNICNFNAVDFEKSSFSKCSFISCIFSSSHMKLTTFTECNFSDIDFSKVNYENGTIDIIYIQDHPRFKKCAFHKCRGMERIQSYLEECTVTE